MKKRDRVKKAAEQKKGWVKKVEVIDNSSLLLIENQWMQDVKLDELVCLPYKTTKKFAHSTVSI